MMVAPSLQSICIIIVIVYTDKYHRAHSLGSTSTMCWQLTWHQSIISIGVTGEQDNILLK